MSEGTKILHADKLQYLGEHSMSHRSTILLHIHIISPENLSTILLSK